MLTIDSDALAAQLGAILNEGLLDPSQIDPKELAFFTSRAIDPNGTIDRGAVTLYFSRAGQQSLFRMIEQILEEKTVARNFSIKEVQSEVTTTIFEAALANDEGRLDAMSVVGGLLERLEEGLAEWTVVWPILNLSMPESRHLQLAGLTLGKLDAAQRSEIATDVEAVGKTVRTGRDGAPGSALPYMQETLAETLASSDSWGVGTIYGRQGAVEEVAQERVVIATDILRCFGMSIGIDPDDSILGIPDQPGFRQALVYQRGKHFGFPGSIYRVPHRYELTAERLDRLQANELFQRAQAISNTESPTDLQQKILLGMMQFGLASRAESREVKLQTYITAIEGLLALEQTEWSGRGKKAGRRLALFLSLEARPRLRQRLDELYKLRWGPAHWAWRNLRGREFISQSDVDDVRLFAYFAVLLALVHCEGLETHADLIAVLDSQVEQTNLEP